MYDEVGATRAVVDVATINQVCDGVYASSKLELELDQVSEGCAHAVEELSQVLDGSVYVRTCEPVRVGSDTDPIREGPPTSEVVSLFTPDGRAEKLPVLA